MNETKNDLSYDESKLDFQAMLTTAEFAVGNLLRNINTYGNKVKDEYESGRNVGMSLNAKWLRDDAQHLVVCTETLATLRGAITRNVLTIVNKPEVKE